MSAALETVVNQLSTSGLVAPAKLERFLPPQANPKDTDDLLDALVKHKQLTAYQAQQINAGKANALVLGSYTLLDRIGAGGMGQVFKAEHRRMKRVVALKTLPPVLVEDAAAIARFEREVEAAAKLEHPNIVTAYDADQAAGVHFLVMQFVDGSDLSALVKKTGPLSFSQAVEYILQAARGLEFAHDKGVVHRDVKPANLLLGKDGVVRILDMGLARIESDGEASTRAELTATGAVMGTVDYMAPDQALDIRHADARADIYSLGCSLYYLIAGRPMYDGHSLMGRLLAHRERPIPSLTDAQVGVPEQLDIIFKKMVAKQVDDRYQSMSEVVEALGGLGLARLDQDRASHNACSATLSSEERKPLVVKARRATWNAPRPAVAFKSTKHLFAKLLGGAFAMIIAPILVAYLIKYLETKESLPKDLNNSANASTAGEKNGSLAEDKEMPRLPGADELLRTNERQLRQKPTGWQGWPADAPAAAIAPFDQQQARLHQQEWARYFTLPIEHTNTIGMKFVLIPPGEFMMGGTDQEIAETLKASGDSEHFLERANSEAPRHKVVLTRPIYLGVHEVTQKQYQAVMGKNPSHFAKTGPDAQRVTQVADLDTGNFPVDSVSWRDATDFCAKLSRHEDLKPLDLRAGEAVSPLKRSDYRLPTEAEWEFACRAGTSSRFWSGDSDGDLNRAGWFGRNAGGRTHAVGELASNSLGLFDLHGNVEEWLQDGGDWKYYEQFASKPATDPVCPFHTGFQRAIRGGHFLAPPPRCRSSYRSAEWPSMHQDYYGFRVAFAAVVSPEREPKTANGE